VRDLQYLITDGKTFFHEEKRDLETTVNRGSDHALHFTVINSDPAGRYSIIKEVVTDPHYADGRWEGRNYQVNVRDLDQAGSKAA